MTPMAEQDEQLVEAIARRLVASDFIEQQLGELTEDHWQEMLERWRDLQSEPVLLRKGLRVEDAMRRARASLAAIDASGTHRVEPSVTDQIRTRAS